MTEAIQQIPQTLIEKNRKLRMKEKQDDNLPTAEIESIKFRPLNNASIAHNSVVEINNSDTSEVNLENTPNDPRLGNMDHNKVCQTCGKNNMTCPGHSGKINLGVSIINPNYYSYIVLVLKCVCHNCGSVLTRKPGENHVTGIERYTKKARMEKIADIGQKSSCPCCNHKNPTIKTKSFNADRRLMVVYDTSGKEEVELTYSKIEEILNKVTDESAVYLGYSYGVHPRDYILKYYPVIAIHARPPNFAQGGQKQNDHITSEYYSLVNITKKNTADRNVNEITTKILTITTNKDGEKIQGKAQTSSIKSRIDGKKGVLRSHLQGKRTNYVGRSVAAPGPMLRFGEIGLPRIMAENICIPMPVNVFNIDEARKLFGETFSECKVKLFIKNGEKNRIGIDTEEQWVMYKEKLEPGCTVIRVVMDGDPVWVGRQPTLSENSLTGYRVKIIDDLVIRAHMSNTTPKNLDFDGDEIHVNIIQTDHAALETFTFANVTNQIIDKKTGNANVGIVYNGVSSGYLLTRVGYELVPRNWDDLYRIGGSSKGEVGSEQFENFIARALRAGNTRYSGRTLFSTLLPDNFYYRKGKVRIEKGIMISGQLGKSTIGVSANTIIQEIWKAYGRDTTVNFITYCTFLLDRFIEIAGLSISINSCNFETENQRESFVEDIRKDTAQLNKVTKDRINNSGKSEVDKDYVEAQITADIKSTVSKYTTRVMKSLNNSNPLKVMVDSGARGSETSALHIVGIVGQQYIYGSRPPVNYSNRTRCLQYYNFNDDSVESHGYITNSFYAGLTAGQLYFHAMASRIGLVDTGINVANTGDGMRRMVKSMEDGRIWYDGSFRNSEGNVFSTVWFDGMNMREITMDGEIPSFVNIGNTIQRLLADEELES